MKMLDYLEKDKSQVMAQLDQAGSPEKAQKVLSQTLQKLLFQYNEDCGEPQEREAAAYMLQTAQMALPLVDTAGEPKVWERPAGMDAAGAGSPAKASGRSTAFLAAGVIALGVSLVAAATRTMGILGALSLPVILIALALAFVLIYLAGYYRGAPAAPGKRKNPMYQVEMLTDTQKAFRCLRAIVISVDQTLEQIGAGLKWEKDREGFEIEDKADAAQIELFASLLEAAASGDGQYALDQLEQVKYYLHTKQIEAVDYSSDTAAWFDVMPSTRTGTIRPALVSGGRLLKKGLASGGN